ncbi:hypothetical protein [Arenibacter sp. ARW7G5Y1]|uniref:hypothetical protein n=1 Tax=Arenibacter sp. ARW7G5Y1 TaxID=2135619 RepID=UPI000D7733E5|nr:hypothetical protein [Arenibacter sp. ARW7G5Y1]PXX25623.1 hypothetical protein C7972_11139 [Arenibacter sp. ARW7G5Y1]
MPRSYTHPDLKFITSLLTNSALVIRNIYSPSIPKAVGHIKKRIVATGMLPIVLSKRFWLLFISKPYTKDCNRLLGSTTIFSYFVNIDG